jgi:hypothetical protein
MRVPVTTTVSAWSVDWAKAGTAAAESAIPASRLIFPALQRSMLRDCLERIIYIPYRGGFGTAEIEADSANAPCLVASSLGLLSLYEVSKSFQRPLYVTELLRRCSIFVTRRNKISRQSGVESVSGEQRFKI